MTYSAEQLQHSGATLRTDGEITEQVGAWVKRQRTRDGEVFPAKDYRDSLMPVKLANGKTLWVDIAALVMRAMSSHQAADITGLGEKGKSNFANELLTAFHNVVSALATGDGMHEDALGLYSGDGRFLTTAESTGGRRTDKTGADNAHFDPEMVIFRDPTGRMVQELGEHVEIHSPRRVYRLKDLMDIKGVDPDKLLPSRDRPVFSEGDLQTIVVDPKKRAVDAGRAAQLGVAKGAAKGVDLDLHAALARMLERTGADPAEALQRGAVPEKMAGLLLRDALVELAARGYAGDLIRSATVNDGKNTVLIPDSRFKDVVVYHKQYGDKQVPVNELGRTKRSSHKENKSGRGDLGALVCRTADGVEFNIGTGFTDADRASIWERRDQFLGLLAKYKFFPVGQKEAPRHPVFLGWRDKLDT